MRGNLGYTEKELEAEVLSTIPATELFCVNIVINIIYLVQMCNIFYLFDSKLIYRERNLLNKVFRVIGFSEGSSEKNEKDSSKAKISRQIIRRLFCSKNTFRGRMNLGLF